jgi:DNA-binding NarL/FixJ family response regulator
MFSNTNPLRLVLADASAIVRAGIRRVLSDAPEIQIIEERTDAPGTIAAIRDLRPDVVLLDFHLESGSAVEVLRACHAVRPRPICIVHAQHMEPCLRAISYAAGADVFYDKGRGIAPLVSLLRKMAVAGQRKQAYAH